MIKFLQCYFYLLIIYHLLEHYYDFLKIFHFSRKRFFLSCIKFWLFDYSLSDLKAIISLRVTFFSKCPSFHFLYTQAISLIKKKKGRFVWVSDILTETKNIKRITMEKLFFIVKMFKKLKKLKPLFWDIFIRSSSKVKNKYKMQRGLKRIKG